MVLEPARVLTLAPGCPHVLDRDAARPWRVPKLAAYRREHDLIPPFCDEWVRRLLRGAGMRALGIRTWKTVT